MADDREKKGLRSQRDIARDGASETIVERNMAADVAAETIRERDMARMQRETAARRDSVRGQAASALSYAAVERGEARGSAVGFYVLLGIVALALLVFALVSLSHSSAPQSSTVVNRITPNVPSAVLTPPMEFRPNRNVPTNPSQAPMAATPSPASAPLAVAPSYPLANIVPPSVLTNHQPSSDPTASPNDNSGKSMTAPDSIPAVSAVGNGTSVDPSASAPTSTSSPTDSVTSVSTPAAGEPTTDAPASTITNNGHARL